MKALASDPTVIVNTWESNPLNHNQLDQQESTHETYAPRITVLVFPRSQAMVVFIMTGVATLRGSTHGLRRTFEICCRRTESLRKRSRMTTKSPIDSRFDLGTRELIVLGWPFFYPLEMRDVKERWKFSTSPGHHRTCRRSKDIEKAAIYHKRLSSEFMTCIEMITHSTSGCRRNEPGVRCCVRNLQTLQPPPVVICKLDGRWIRLTLRLKLQMSVWMGKLQYQTCCRQLESDFD